MYFYCLLWTHLVKKKKSYEVGPFADADMSRGMLRHNKPGSNTNIQTEIWAENNEGKHAKGQLNKSRQNIRVSLSSNAKMPFKEQRVFPASTLQTINTLFLWNASEPVLQLSNPLKLMGFDCATGPFSSAQPQTQSPELTVGPGSDYCLLSSVDYVVFVLRPTWLTWQSLWL